MLPVTINKGELTGGFDPNKELNAVFNMLDFWGTMLDFWGVVVIIILNNIILTYGLPSGTLMPMRSEGVSVLSRREYSDYAPPPPVWSLDINSFQTAL